MTDLLAFIIWSPVPEIFPNGFLGTDYSPRWYGLLFALGFIIGQQILYYMYKQEGKPQKDVDTITIFMVVGTIIGARFGHVFFYEPEIFLNNPLDLFAVWKGGLASHGAAIGILTALWLYTHYDIRVKWLLIIPTSFKATKRNRKKEGQSFLYVVDRIVILVALGGAFIRMGNFVNSEILGKPTDSDYGVVFSRVPEQYIQNSNRAIENVSSFRYKTDTLQEGLAPLGLRIQFQSADYDSAQVKGFIEREVKNILVGYERTSEQIDMSMRDPIAYDLAIENNKYVANVYLKGIIRHPAQLYESVSTFILFVLLLGYWFVRKQKIREGSLLGIFLVYIFALRFIYEFYKENQVAFEDNLTLNMGQILSIPLVIAGLILFIWVNRRKPVKN